MDLAAVKVWLVRHGSTEWSDAGRFNGRTDIPLNESGRAQARALRTRLPTDPSSHIWSSPLSRAIETARLALGEPEVDERISELDFGRLEGKTWSECPPGSQERLLRFDDYSAPGGETVAELGERVDGFLGDLGPGPHVVFTHGGVIRLLLRRRGIDRRVAPGEVVSLALGIGIDGGDNR